MSNERNRDFRGAQSRESDQGGAGGRDPGEEALLELARLIGGQNDPFAPAAPQSEPRLSDVTRAAAPQGDGFRRRDPDFGESRMAAAPGRLTSEPPLAPQAGNGFDYPEPSRHAAAEGPGYDFGDDGRSRSPRGRGRQSYEPQHEEYGGGYGDDYGEPDDYGDEPDGPRRRPIRMIMILLGLAAVVGGAAYGYRTMIDAAPSGPTPIIRADNSPTKITPMSDVRQDSGRAGDRTGERLLRRDEEPVDVAGSGAADAGASDVVPPESAPALPGDPRRVHTVPIRADQGTASSPDRPGARASTAQPASRQVAAPRAVAAAAATAQPAPAAAAAPPQTRQAAVTPPADAPAAAPSESGGYVVQLAALRSEADAQAAFQKMQTKYPMLGNRQPLIRRKDRGDQGIFFATLVGPFGAKSDADQLCEQLKAAGGSCFVYKN